ncbi:MAG: enoyl-CoA hydratase/isomerase family protein [Acidimicrobiia bacterium]|nr:enoyl-CoA hydratase/isomerase family protein [Acidimicrobiia bacterium]
MQTEWNTLRLEIDGHVAHLILDRPDKLNSFTIEMWRELRELGQGLVADPGPIRSLIVIGSGRAFSSGIDTSVFSGGGQDGIAGGADGGTRHPNPMVDGIMRTQEAFSWLEDAPFATIAAARGYALGAGLQIALACDIRIFARGISVGLLEHKYGIIPDLGGTQRLPRIVGTGKAKEMIFTAARIDAEESLRIGLCEQVVPDEELEEAAQKLADRIAAQPPLAVREAKRAINAGFDLPIADGLRIEAEAQSVCLPSQDMREAVTAFVEGRDPVYRGE